MVQEPDWRGVVCAEDRERGLRPEGGPGALPQLYAATAPGVQGGQFFGPSGFQEFRGDVTAVQAVPEAHDREIGRRLWTVSEELTGVTFPLPVPAA